MAPALHDAKVRQPSTRGKLSLVAATTAAAGGLLGAAGSHPCACAQLRMFEGHSSCVSHAQPALLQEAPVRAHTAPVFVAFLLAPTRHGACGLRIRALARDRQRRRTVRTLYTQGRLQDRRVGALRRLVCTLTYQCAHLTSKARYEGVRVRKRFGRAYFEGTVDDVWAEKGSGAINAHIAFDDGDQEDVDIGEVAGLLLAKRTPAKAKRKEVRMRGCLHALSACMRCLPGVLAVLACAMMLPGNLLW